MSINKALEKRLYTDVLSSFMDIYIYVVISLNVSGEIHTKREKMDA